MNPSTLTYALAQDRINELRERAARSRPRRPIEDRTAQAALPKAERRSAIRTALTALLGR